MRLPLVPSLARIAARRPRGGFTLIELTVAIAISMVVIIAAVTAFRVFSRAIAAGTSLSIENSLLLVGWRTSLDDVDYYRSLADDRPPYDKGFMRARTQRADDPTTPDVTEPLIRRPFQPIMFDRRTDPDAQPFDSDDPTKYEWNLADQKVMNPDVLQAHDPRSIDRSHLWFDLTPSSGNYRFVSPVWVHGDYRLVCATDMRSKPDEVSPLFPTGIRTGGTASVPVDLDKRNVDGNANPPDPWAGKADAEFTETIPNLPLRPSVNQAVPLLYWQMFNRCSLLGATEYTSMGYNLFLQDQNGNPPGDDMGWAPGETIGTSPRNFPSNCNDAPCTELAPNWWGVGGLWWRSDEIGCRDFSNWIGLDFFNNTWSNMTHTWAIGIVPKLSTGSEPGQGGGIDHQGGLTLLIEGAGAAGGGNQNWYYGYAQDNNTGDVARNDKRFTSRTVRLPYNVTDGECAQIDPGKWYNQGGIMTGCYIPTPLDYDSKPRDYPVLETTILRYFRAGGQGQLTVATTTVQDPTTGRRVEIVFSPYGTSYRGARQHWRLSSPAYTDKRAIGDFYDTDAGPLYTPPASAP